MLRIDRNGNGAPGNPGGDFLPQIYTYGHRNPQGIAFRPATARPISVEHGPGCDDEINLLVPGGNYGWDPTVGASTAYNQNVPMTDKARHPDAIDASWTLGLPHDRPSGGAFLSGDQWKGWNGALAVAVLKDQELHVFAANAAGKIGPAQLQWTYFQNSYGRLRRSRPKAPMATSTCSRTPTPARSCGSTPQAEPERTCWSGAGFGAGSCYYRRRRNSDPGIPGSFQSGSRTPCPPTSAST